MPAKPDLNPIHELGILMNGETVEKLVDEFLDPGCHYSPGQRAKLSAALIAAGNKLETDLQEQFAGVIEHFDDGVILKWKWPTTSTRVNTDEVKLQYPEKDHPSLYYQSETKARLGIELPFVKSRLVLREEPVPQQLVVDPPVDQPMPPVECDQQPEPVSKQTAMDFADAVVTGLSVVTPKPQEPF